MTAGQLRRRLADLPDDAYIYVTDGTAAVEVSDAEVRWVGDHPKDFGAHWHSPERSGCEAGMRGDLGEGGTVARGLVLS